MERGNENFFHWREEFTGERGQRGRNFEVNSAGGGCLSESRPKREPQKRYGVEMKNIFKDCGGAGDAIDTREQKAQELKGGQ